MPEKATGVPGDAHVQNIASPGGQNCDLSADKTWILREPVNLTFRSDFSNAFNHPQFTYVDSGKCYIWRYNRRQCGARNPAPPATELLISCRPSRIPRIASVGCALLLACSPALSRAAAFIPLGQTTRGPAGVTQQPCFSEQEAEGLLSSATSLLEQGRFDEAVQLLRSNSQRRCDYRVDLLLAAAFEGKNDIPDAERTLEKANAAWPGNCSIAASLARYQLGEGKAAEAKSAVSRCVPTRSTPDRELRLIATVYLENEEPVRAERAALLAWKSSPSEQNLLLLANILQLQGRYMDVVSLLERQRSTYGNSAGFLITIAESESDGKLYTAARRDLEKAIGLDPNSYPAHYVLGNLLVTTGHVSEGIEQYRKAIELSPQQPRTYYQIGRGLEQQGNTAEAQKYFQQTLSIDAHYAPAWCEIGKLELRASQLQPAVDDLNRAIQYNPALQESYYLLVQAYARLGERDKSRAVMTQWDAYRKAHPLRPATADPMHIDASSAPSPAAGSTGP